MDKHKNLLKMLSGCQYTRDIAALYFPFFKRSVTQMKAFRQTIGQTPGMAAEMAAKGYQDNATFITPQIIAVIVKFWGLPDEVEAALSAQGKE